MNQLQNQLQNTYPKMSFVMYSIRLLKVSNIFLKLWITSALSYILLAADEGYGRHMADKLWQGSKAHH